MNERSLPHSLAHVKAIPAHAKTRLSPTIFKQQTNNLKTLIYLFSLPLTRITASSPGIIRLIQPKQSYTPLFARSHWSHSRLRLRIDPKLIGSLAGLPPLCPHLHISFCLTPAHLSIPEVVHLSSHLHHFPSNSPSHHHLTLLSTRASRLAPRRQPLSDDTTQRVLHQHSTKMAIYSSIPPPDQQSALPLPIQTTPIDIQSWTATSALQALSISPSARGTGVSLSIPLDDDEDTRAKSPPKKKKDALRRDSMKRRDALLKGKEGSRRRQRWENGRSFPSASQSHPGSARLRW